MEWKMKIPEMELLLSVIHGHGLLAAFIFLLVNLSPSSSLSQGNGLPRMTSNIKEVLGRSFDYIIVGGGTAGCPLAATLSEKFSVLLIERGGSPYENPTVLDKKYFGFPFLQTDDFSSVAQRFISEDGVPNLRGRVLGGTSTINAGFYSRASADFIKRVGWDEKLVKEAYEWVESKIVFKPLLTKWSSAVMSALLEAGILPFNGFSWDHIAGTKIGGTVFDADRKRHISADLLERGNSSNIVVLLNATVKNIVFQRDGNKSAVRGIRFINSNGSINQTYEAYLSQPPENSSQQGDVILSAGALGSPQILLLSGIGPRAHLENFSIPLLLDLKGVGQDMQDNPGIPLILRAKPEHRLPEPPQVVGIAKDFKFIVEGFVLPVSFNATTLMRVSIKLAFPESKGKLELNSTDPRQNPVVLFNYLAEEKDLRECVQMVQLVKKVARSRSIARFLGTKPRINVTSNPNELRNFCRKNVRTYYHFHGGCSVGSVIDRDYRVIGVKGLRVLDGSTLSESPGTNPMATLLMLGRYQGIKILKERESASAFGSQQHP